MHALLNGQFVAFFCFLFCFYHCYTRYKPFFLSFFWARGGVYCLQPCQCNGYCYEVITFFFFLVASVRLDSDVVGLVVSLVCRAMTDSVNADENRDERRYSKVTSCDWEEVKLEPWQSYAPFTPVSVIQLGKKSY